MFLDVHRLMNCRIHILSLFMTLVVGMTACVSRPPLKTVADRLAEFGPAARSRLQPMFQKAGVAYPPRQVVLVAFKQERVLEVHAGDGPGALRKVTTYPILGASGGLGPKLREGDRQVPEGMYSIAELNPNSRHEIALKLNYPNAFDLKQAAKDGRQFSGSHIMIHGSDTSIGCLAMGDEVAADLFVLTADVGIENLQVILSPVDFRKGVTVSTDNQPFWVNGLYEIIRSNLSKFPMDRR